MKIFVELSKQNTRKQFRLAELRSIFLNLYSPNYYYHYYYSYHYHYHYCYYYYHYSTVVTAVAATTIHHNLMLIS